jgi:hypothetical protein
MTPEQYDAQQPGLILHPSHLPTAGYAQPGPAD